MGLLEAKIIGRTTILKYGLRSAIMANAPGLPCRVTGVTGSVTLTASPWPTRAQTRGSWRTLQATAIFSTPSVTRLRARRGFRAI